MGNIEDDKSVNSIYDENIAAQYVDNINAYPLALDAAIACYSWGLLYDNHQLLRIFYPLYQDEISDSLFSKVENNTYKANGNFYFEGSFCKRQHIKNRNYDTRVKFARRNNLQEIYIMRKLM
ncbi:MAG: hypothetical protein IPO03_21385 [Bacteroidetes bacterium]|nr:hypothetical protein [Bacteroidota bacterium]